MEDENWKRFRSLYRCKLGSSIPFLSFDLSTLEAEIKVGKGEYLIWRWENSEGWRNVKEDCLGWD